MSETCLDFGDLLVSQRIKKSVSLLNSSAVPVRFALLAGRQEEGDAAFTVTPARYKHDPWGQKEA